MAFWIVFQGNSYARSMAGGYMWAPKRGKAGQTQAYWATMARVQPGDLIFSGVNNAIRAASQATGSAYDAERPDPQDAEHWDGIGWKLDVVYTELAKPLPYAGWVPSIVAEMPSLHSAFTALGRPNQGYLYELPISVGELLVELTREQGFDAALAAATAALLPPGGDTERDALIKARVGQGKFRKDLVARWAGACAVTGLSRPELLRASHIKPWSGSNNQERLDVHNGLLLSAAYDAAFDARLIGFKPDGTVYLAPDFDLVAAQAAGIDLNARLSTLNPKTQPYLAVHRQLVTTRVRRAATGGAAGNT